MADNLNKSTEQINRSLGQRVKGAEKEIAKQYAILLNEVRKELATYYEKYEVEGKLTYADMAKYDRLTKFMKYVDGLLTSHYSWLKKVIYTVLGESYLDGYYLTAWAVEVSTLSRLNYSTIAAETIAAAIDNPLTDLSKRIHKNMQNSIFEIRNVVTSGLVQGQTYGTMAKGLKEALALKTYEAVRIVRSESHRVSEQSKLDSVIHANKNGIVTMKTWMSMEDGRVRKGISNHRKLNDKKLPIDGLFDDGLCKGLAPGQLMGSKSGSSNINCRCILLHSVERIEKPDAKELENMAFDTWKKERLKQ